MEYVKTHIAIAIKKKIAMRSLKVDIQRYFMISGKSLSPAKIKKIKIILENYGIHAIIVYRFGSWLESKTTNNKLFLSDKMMYSGFKNVFYRFISL